MNINIKKLNYLRDKSFYNIMLGIAIPITVQNLISTSLNMVDTVMIGRIGENELASVGIANQIFFLFILMAFGINSGASIFIAQYWGKKDVQNIRKVLGLTLILGGVVSLFFSIAAFFTPDFILGLFTEDPKVVEIGSKYLRIVSLSYIVTMVSFAYGFASRSVGQAKLPMYISAISLGINTLLNYLLIFGKLGFPMMGVEGAALATVISRVIEMSILLFVIYKNDETLAAKFSEMVAFSKPFIKKFFDTTLPVILNESFWSLGMVMYTAAYGRIGTGALAAIQIASTIQNIFLVINKGLANASAVMLGNQLGSNHKEKAIAYAFTFLFLGITVGLALGVIMYLCAPLTLYFFEVSEGVYRDTIKIIIVMSIFMFIKIYNAIVIVGVLRSGGDTKFALILEIGSVWLIGVPLAFVGALLWKLPIYWVVFLVSLEEIVKAIVGLPRVLSTKWAKNVVDEL